jgi:hypothetical protein
LECIVVVVVVVVVDVIVVVYWCCVKLCGSVTVNVWCGEGVGDAKTDGTECWYTYRACDDAGEA